MGQYTNTYTTSHAVVVGIDDYKDDSFQPLGEAEADARAVADLLADEPYSFSVRTLFGEEATKAAVIGALGKLSADTQPDDRIVFYFAGHGYTRPNKLGVEVGYLACSDTVPRNPYAGLEFTEVTKLCEWADAKHIAFILDACFSGKALGLTRGISGAAADKYMTRRAWQVLTAGGDEVVADAQSMTDILVRALQEGVPGERGPLTFSDVGKFVKDEMAARTRGMQIPVCQYLAGSGNGEMILLSPSPLDALPEHLRKDLNDANPRVRYYVIGEMAYWLDEPLVGMAVCEILEKVAIEDPDVGVRRRAFEVLRVHYSSMPDSDVEIVSSSEQTYAESAPTAKSDLEWGSTSVEPLRTLLGHTGWVESIAFTPDGSMLASSSRDGTVILWDVGSGERLRILGGHANWVTSVTFSPDGAMLASGSGDDTIILWDVMSGKPLRALDHTSWVWSVAFSPDGATLASGSGDSSVVLWDVARGEQLRTLKSHTDSVNCVAFSPDGATLASGSNDGTVILWDMVSGERLDTLLGYMGWVLNLVFANDGAMLASVAEKGIVLWRMASRERRHAFYSFAWDVAFSPDGATLASSLFDGTIHLWDAETGKQMRTLVGHADAVQSVAFSSDGTLLASGSRDRTIILWGREA